MKRHISLAIFLLILCTTSHAQQSEWKDLIEKKQFDKVIAQAADMQPADSVDFSKMYLLGQAYEGLLKYRDAYNCYSNAMHSTPPALIC